MGGITVLYESITRERERESVIYFWQSNEAAAEISCQRIPISIPHITDHHDRHHLMFYSNIPFDDDQAS